MKEIYIKTEFIKLGQFLKFIGVIENGSQAKEFLIENEVLVNKLLEQKRGKKLINGDEIFVLGQNYIIKQEVS